MDRPPTLRDIQNRGHGGQALDPDLGNRENIIRNEYDQDLWATLFSSKKELGDKNEVKTLEQPEVKVSQI